MNRVLNAKHPFVPPYLGESGVVQGTTNQTHPISMGDNVQESKKLKLVMPDEEPGATTEHYVAADGDSLPTY